LLAYRPHTRDALAQRLGVDVRGFYRDLELLRKVNVPISVAGGRYSLEADRAEAIDRLPFPDPLLTVGEVRELARGNSPAQKKLQERLSRLVR
jgi:predicted DNA-binding transcriptional regulator YafY